MRFARDRLAVLRERRDHRVHHDQEIDAPSGTAVMTAQRMAAASNSWRPIRPSKQIYPGARGGKGPRASPCIGATTRLVAHTEACSARPDKPSASATTPPTVRRSCPADPAVKAIGNSPGRHRRPRQTPRHLDLPTRSTTSDGSRRLCCQNGRFLVRAGSGECDGESAQAEAVAYLAVGDELTYRGSGTHSIRDASLGSVGSPMCVAPSARKCEKCGRHAVGRWNVVRCCRGPAAIRSPPVLALGGLEGRLVGFTLPAGISQPTCR